MGYGHLIKINFTFPNSSPLCLESTTATIPMDIDNVEEFKFTIECDYHATDASNIPPKYFVFNPSVSNASPITVTWCEKRMESDPNLDDSFVTKENCVYQLIPRLSDKIRNNKTIYGKILNCTSTIKILHQTLLVELKWY